MTRARGAAIVLLGLVACGPTEQSSLITAAENGDSPIQFRIVLNESAQGCDESDKNPAADVQAVLPTLDGECFAVGPSLLEVEKLDAEIEGETGERVLTVAFDDADAEVFRQITESNLQKRIASVMFGRIVTAPAVMEPIVDGKASIYGGTDAEQEALKRELSE